MNKQGKNCKTCGNLITDQNIFSNLKCDLCEDSLPLSTIRVEEMRVEARKILLREVMSMTETKLLTFFKERGLIKKNKCKKGKSLLIMGD